MLIFVCDIVNRLAVGVIENMTDFHLSPVPVNTAFFHFANGEHFKWKLTVVVVRVFRMSLLPTWKYCCHDTEILRFLSRSSLNPTNPAVTQTFYENFDLHV